MGIEVIDRLADDEGRFMFTSQGNIVPLIPCLEEARVVASRTTGSNDAVGTTVHIFHTPGLLVEVSALALDDANRVDPEVPASKTACDNYSILESGWESLEIHALDMVFEIAAIGIKMRWSAPLIGQGDPFLLVFGAGLPETDFFVASFANINESRW